MDGCIARERLLVQRDTALAWRTAKLTALASVGKLKGLQTYLDELKPQHQTSVVLEAVATFTHLAKRGLVTIKEVPKKGEANGG